MTTLPKFAGLRKAVDRAPIPGIVLAWILSVAVIASVAGLVAYKVADSNGYDRGFSAGHTQGYGDGKAAGFTDGKAEGLQASQTKYNDGYAAGKSAGYSAGQSAGYDTGYSAAMNDATQVIEEYLPTIIQTAYNNGRASTPIYVPGFDFGGSTIYCRSTDLGSYTSVNCH
jgi:hypothetical protein